MIIQILSNLFEEGYVSRENYTSLSPFFAGANVAFRKKALDQVGTYDVNCFSGEDQDMCLRIANAGWDLYFEPGAKVRHKNVMSLRALLRKWYNHGFQHPYLFRKFNSGKFNIYRTSRKGNDASLYKTVVDFKWPFGVHIFITPFVTMHVLLALAVIFAIAGLAIPALVALCLLVIRALFYFKGDLDIRNISRSIAFIFLRYTINLALIAGGFLGGLRSKMLYIGATFDYIG
jgi:cellulose synthase/poly-beta-1,6-N-acetylglucosamine synthase-like glycosyltransferase